MSPYNFKQSFWLIDAGTGDIGAQTRAQIAKAALALSDHQDIVLATSAGGYTADERPEIALVVAIDHDVPTLLPVVEGALAAEGLLVKAHLQGNVRYYEFGATELLNIAEATKVADLQAARDMLDELAALPLQPVSTERLDIADVLRAITGATAESAAGVPPSEIAEGFSVTKARFDRLKGARGDAVKDELKALTKTFASLQKEHSTNAATATMVASGLMTIGSAMFKLYTAVQSAGSISALVSSLLAAVGGITGVAAIVAVIAVLFGLLWIILKDAVNLLLFVNGQGSGVEFVEDYIKNGQRKTIVQSIGPANPNVTAKPAAFPCGFYFYHKRKIFSTPAEPEEPNEPNAPDVPIGFYGSCMGVTFRSFGQRFSVGMDCPNTIFGGTNCIRVTSGTAKEAAKLANDSGFATESIRVGSFRCTVSRAAKLGSINYGICYLG